MCQLHTQYAMASAFFRINYIHAFHPTKCFTIFQRVKTFVSVFFYFFDLILNCRWRTTSWSCESIAVYFFFALSFSCCALQIACFHILCDRLKERANGEYGNKEGKKQQQQHQQQRHTQTHFFLCD